MSATRRSPTRGILVLTFGIVLAALLAMHSLLPTTSGIALIVETMLPWTWILVALLLLVALFRLSLLSIAGVVVPAVVWASMFWPYLRPASAPEDPDLTLATQNVGAKLPQPSATALSIIDEDPDIVAVQEIASLSGQIIEDQMEGHFTHGAVVDSLGVWSKWPMSQPEEVDIGVSWPRAIRTTVHTDSGDVRVYVVHIPSVRPGMESARNIALGKLADAVSSDPAERVIVAGDLNTAASDRNFSTIGEDLEDSREAVGGGFGFTWPGVFPVTRLDHVLSRGLDPVGDEVLGRGTSDHRAILASYDF
ncbi:MULTISPECIES: endonuclease/exonuclease/phosphatase family protein [Brevibacterium]|uniref:Teicoplanin resistance protein VanJ n=1 Tax=Brevibacterium salitolerans TaxID=1403566 RepID=A0ABN2WPD3_9MICO|nr:endonuclease/exonuclease/phosphatase family protein [Brevibacterium sp.]